MARRTAPAALYAVVPTTRWHMCPAALRRLLAQAPGVAYGHNSSATLRLHLAPRNAAAHALRYGVPLQP